MSLFLDIEENLPPPIIAALNASLNVRLHRVGNFYKEKTGPGCGSICIWNGGGYYMDMFACGETYPSGLTFYCCSDCHCKVGDSQKVFLSYRWCDSEIADKISSCARGAGIDIIRDINKIGFLDAISSFMDTACESRYFVAVMTESYFYSRNCMYEFCQLNESDQPVRTIPVMLGKSVELGIEDELQNCWRRRYQNLSQAIRGIDSRYTDYLRSELDLLATISDHIDNFYKFWRAKERPEGKRWLIANCRYLVGAIKTTFKPTEEEATNWTYSNKTVRGEQAEDAPPAATWKQQPFFLHAYSNAESQIVTRSAQARKLLLGVYHDEPTPEALAPGVHLALVNESALRSLTFCKRLQHLLDRDDVTLVPIFLDKALQMPASEIGLVRRWYDQLTCTAASTEREQIAFMLIHFGPMIERLRDTLAPSVDIVFTG